MKKRYRDLDLKSLAKECGLDFAHYTYVKGMCSCCYGPLHMYNKYWTKGKKGKERAKETGEYTYILFKNANNGSGEVGECDFIEDETYISYHLNDDAQMDIVCEALQNQLGPFYKVI